MTSHHPRRPKEKMNTHRKKFSAWVYAAIIAKQSGKCACGCGEELGTDPRDIHYDHDLPLWMGGADAPDNLRALKARHHLDKTAREAPKLAKVRRIVAGGSHRRRNLNATERELQKMLEGKP